MGDLSKRELRRQGIIEAVENQRPVVDWVPPKCHCGEPAKYEVNRPSGVTFVCARHLPSDL